MDTVLWGVIILLFVAGGVGRARRKIRPAGKESTVLLAHTFTDTPVIIPGHSMATPGGLYCQFLAGGMLTRQMKGIYCVELPFQSGVHLLGLPKQGEDLSVDTAGSSMEPVDLEGDYPNYFSLYADKGEQVEARFVLDPKAMVFTIDFCRDFSWEIAGDALYFTSDKQIISFELIDQFVAEIRPSIEIASDRRANPQMRMPYAHFEGRKMNCPICSKQLAISKEWLGCPDGHGVLVTASQLSDLRDIDGDEKNKNAEEINVAQSGGNPVAHDVLSCPYCQSSMEPTEFAFTNVQIDVCPKCMFRWLDAGEAKRLFID